MGPILAVALGGGGRDQVTHQARGAALGVDVGAVVDDVGDVVHLAAGDAHGGEVVEAPTRRQAHDGVVHDARVAALGRRDGGEEEVGGVGDPVEPVEFAEDGHAAAHLHARVEVVVRGHVAGQEELAAGDLLKGGLDERELGFDRRAVAVLRAVEHPRDVAARELGGVLADDFSRHGAFAVVPVGFGLASDSEFLDDVSELGDVAEDAFEGQRADDLDDGFKVVLAREGDHVGLVVGFGH